MLFLKRRLPRRPHSDQGVATELLWRPIAFLRSSYWRFYALSRRVHCAFTALTLRALCCHGVRTVLSRRLHCADGVASQKYVNIRNCSIQNLNQALKTKTGNNYMCNIKKSKYERTYCQPSEQLFFKKVATQQLKLNYNNINTRKVKRHRNSDTKNRQQTTRTKQPPWNGQ